MSCLKLLEKRYYRGKKKKTQCIFLHVTVNPPKLQAFNKRIKREEVV